MMKFGYTIFYVADVEKTIAFYERAFGFSRKFISPEKDYGELVTGDTTISFASFALGASNFPKGYEKISSDSKPVGMEIAFVSDNIDLDFKKAIEEGAEEYVEVVSKPWGQKVGYLRDINGILIEVCSPMKS